MSARAREGAWGQRAGAGGALTIVSYGSGPITERRQFGLAWCSTVIMFPGPRSLPKLPLCAWATVLDNVAL